MFEIYFDEYKAPYETIPIGHQGENEARCLIWNIADYIEEFGSGSASVRVTQPVSEDVYLATNVSIVDNYAIWTITSVDTAEAGTGMCELYYYDSSGDVVAKSDVMRTWVLPTQGATGDTPSPYEDLLEQVAAYASSASVSATQASNAASSAASAVSTAVATEKSERVAADSDLQTQITQIKAAVGGPSVASHVGDMTDTSKVYVYTGSETGYTYGNWYYYNGSEWISGGVYNATAIDTDKTLSIEDMAADAGAIGEFGFSIVNGAIYQSYIA